MSDIVKIKEKYISSKVLPNEHSSSWIKWVAGVTFDKLILRCEADVEIHRIFNVDEKVFEIMGNWKGEVTIPRELIQIDGFFGFTSYYTAIPDKERKISYEIDVILGEKVQTIHLENIITRPMIEIVKSSPESIQLSKFSPSLQPFSVQLKNLGIANVSDLTYVIDFITNDKLKVEIITSEQTKLKEMLLKDEQLTSQKISINGKGYGLIKMSIEYRDDNNTKYIDTIREIPIYVEEIQNELLPIAENLERQETQLLTISK